MFKKTLLALAVAGVSITANAATIKTTSTAVAADAAAQLALEEKLVKQEGAGKTGLGGDDKFGFITGPGIANDSCGLLAESLDATLVLGALTDKAANDHVATLKAANDSFSKNLVIGTGATACDVYLAAETSSDVVKDGVEYSTVKAIEIEPVVVAGIGGYKDGDTLTFKLSGAKLDTTQTLTPTITSELGKSTAGVSFDVLDITEDQIRFTVQSADPQNDFIRGSAILKLSGIFLDSTGLSSSSSVVLNSFATNKSGTQFDVASAAVVKTLVPQYTAEVTQALDESIDVGKDRQEFAGGNTDELKLKVTNNVSAGGGTGKQLVPDVATYVITGDFSWMADATIDADKDGKLTTVEIAKAVDYAGGNAVKSYALNTEMTELTVKTNAAAGVDTTPSFTFKVPGFDQGKLENVMINVQDFTVKVDVLSDKSINSKSANMPALSTTAAGDWDLNGSVVILPYIPFGANTQPILRHTNAGTRVGDVTMRYMIEGEDVTWKALPAASMKDVKPGVRNILGLVTDALKAEGYDKDAKSFKAAIEIVTNVPAKDIHVFAGAKVDSSDSSRINLGAYKTNNDK